VRGLPLFTVLLACALPALGLDQESWLDKRESMMREAVRLRVAYSNCVAKVSEPAEDVIVPIETHPSGAVKLVIAARKAQFFLDEGFIWAAGVTLRKLDEDGKELSRIEAEHCLFDRNPAAKSGWAEGAAKVTHKDSVFTGEDVYFSSRESYVLALRKSQIVSVDAKFGGGL